MDHQLDELVLSDEYIPPVPFFDLDYAKQAVEARYIIEQGAEAQDATEAARLPAAVARSGH